MALRRVLPSASTCSCPTISPRFRGRIRAARGASNPRSTASEVPLLERLSMFQLYHSRPFREPFSPTMLGLGDWGLRIILIHRRGAEDAEIVWGLESTQ